MYILHHHIVRNHQISMGKVPDSFNAGLYQTVCDLRRLCLWNGQGCDLNFVLLDKKLQIIHRPDLNSADHKTNELWIDIKHTLDNKSTSLKIRIVGNSLAQVSGTDNNQVVLLVNSQNLCYLSIQVLYIISVSLLSESSEIIKILADL